MIRRIATGATIALSCLYLGLAVIPAEMGFAVATIGTIAGFQMARRPVEVR